MKGGMVLRYEAVNMGKSRRKKVPADSNRKIIRLPQQKTLHRIIVIVKEVSDG